MTFERSAEPCDSLPEVIGPYKVYHLRRFLPCGTLALRWNNLTLCGILVGVFGDNEFKSRAEVQEPAVCEVVGSPSGGYRANHRKRPSLVSRECLADEAEYLSLTAEPGDQLICFARLLEKLCAASLEVIAYNQINLYDIIYEYRIIISNIVVNLLDERSSRV